MNRPREADPRLRRIMLALLGSSILSACSTLPPPSRGRFDPFDRDFSGTDPEPAAALPEDLAREASFLALSLVDTPYRYGGNTPAGGFDCSGLIVYVFRNAAGLGLPRTVARLAQVGQPVRPSAMRSGDLVLFDTTGRFSHAGIYVGAGRFVHAPSTGGVVRLDDVHARYWKPRFSGVRRV